ncbi:MAG: hypothetical protein QM621_00560 [Aeromicrobium sp.]|uniref:septum site-determining protein Ssd n=1 Tax=Aeromicrobium sp. TaxID=1871063 RepID=UPI0039E6F870
MNTSTIVIAATDSLVREAAERWIAALGAHTETAGSPAAARRHWGEASAVVLDRAMARQLVETGAPRRPHVLLVDDRADEDVWRTAVEVGAATVCRPDESGREEALERLAVALDGRGEACVVAVVGAVGGVGASTLAAGLAATGARRGWRALLADLDPFGGADLLLGAEQAAGSRWDTLDVGGGRLPAGALLDVLPRHEGVHFLTRSRESSAPPPDPGDVLAAARRAVDLVVLDVPRHPAALSVVSRAELTVAVVPEDVRGVAAARHLLDAVQAVAGTVVVVTRAVPGGLGRAAVASAVPAPVVGRLRRRRPLARDVAAGRGPGRDRGLTKTADAVLGLVGLEAAS